MYPLNLTPHPFNGSVIAGKWKITCCRRKCSDWSDTETVFYRADNYKSVSDLVSSMHGDMSPVKIELVGVYFYELYFDLEDCNVELPFDLSVFLYCLF